jgi:hypothetical protein
VTPWQGRGVAAAGVDAHGHPHPMYHPRKGGVAGKGWVTGQLITQEREISVHHEGWFATGRGLASYWTRVATLDKGWLATESRVG